MTNHKAIKTLESLRIKIKMRHMCKSMDGDCTKEDVQEYKDEFAALLMAEKALKDGSDMNVPSKWIPCSERLPEEEGSYLLTLTTASGIRYVGMGLLFSDGKFAKHDSVIAWMPLPEPYKGETE